MIYLFTGVNGSSKTLNALKFVCEDSAFKMESANGDLVSRPVYYFNINECKLPWTELSLEECRSWFNLPKGSIIFIDECYKVFPPRQGRDDIPDYIAKLAEHRKDGYDFVLVCQKVVGQVDAFVRGLVGRHVHLERIFNTDSSKWFQWQKCIDNVNDYHERNTAETKTIFFDKKYYGVYKSAEIHTIKSNLPWFKLVGFGLAFILVGGLIIYLIYHFSNWGKSVNSNVKESAAIVSGSLVPTILNSGASPVMSTRQYLDRFKPRLEGLPATAPAYDDLTKPRSYPKLNCMLWTTGDRAGECHCYTQQATKYTVKSDLCINIVQNGFFDPAKPDSSDKGERDQALARPRPSTSSDVLVTRQ